MKNYKLLIYTFYSFYLKLEMFYPMRASFTVNNIQINKNDYKNKDELINIAFKKGFEKLNSKILLEERL